MISFEFVKEIPKSKKCSSVYEEEKNVIKKLLVSNEIAVKLAYPVARKAQIARASIKRWFKQSRISNLDMAQRGSDLFVFKTN